MIDPSTLVCFLLICCFVLWVWYTTRSYLELRHIPGPYLAAWTNLPRTLWVLGNEAHAKHVALHKQYGPIVRFGPTMVSVQDPREIKHIYDMSGTFVKSDFYRALVLYAKGKPVPTIFGTQDLNLHRTLRRPIASLYSMSNVVTFESLVDKAILVFLGQLRTRFVSTGVTCDLGEWLEFLAFDVMGEMTFSRRFGFLDSGTDVNNIATNNKLHFDKTSPITQITWIDWIWSKNPLVQHLQPTKTNPVVTFAHQRCQERRSAEKAALSTDEPQTAALNNNDFLSRFDKIMAKDQSIPPFALTAWTVSNVAAGSDTTAILLRTIVHELLQDAQSMNRLIKEIDEAVSISSNPSDVVQWSCARKLPYLDAVIKEAGRLHPSFGLPFERVVPAPGATICGKWLKAGTIVGMSAWVMHHHEGTFGRDHDRWRPERWLDCSDIQRKAMEASLLTFGAGNRVCLGKNVAYFEVYKIVPTLLRAFEIHPPMNGKVGWEVKNRWFVQQKGLKVNLVQRKIVSKLSHNNVEAQL
ncbi:benzoate 4-monooxygenase cytochrome P450 [Plenodomus tracheiphilus IPT5]|uniref:Benzoate 4-monooxygenase cytochrome P450 n=1 Tax=Plenodomus tracheiphilus IPT5 TaxID=1408161 RepID=A0A6A7AX17_9PLEO|nr:benzoate 4-monooxygenase cytochrome P450 [Plenodomus tracheiphilus IPT5]